MGKLLDTDNAPFTSKTSLLRGQWMYEELLTAFREMNSAPQDSEGGYRQAEQIDLFVTATDLNGVSIPIRLSDQDVNERVHKASFHFEFDAIQVPNIDAKVSGLPETLDFPGKDHFARAFDPLLAFAARCTSSFPVAFPPMKLSNIEPVVGKSEYVQLKAAYREFFRWVPPQPMVQDSRCELDFDERELADGGYLENKPFGYVIDALTYRPTTVRHARKLLYIDPFPEGSKDNPQRAHFDFILNALSATTELPRYETIRGDISRIKVSNRTQERLGKLKDQVTDTWTDSIP
jgi:patatin-related protein